MKEKKELTLGKAVASIILTYTILTVIFGILSTVITTLLSNLIGNVVIMSTISVILSILIIIGSWKLSVMFTFRNSSSNELDTKKIMICLVIFLVTMSVLSIGLDFYTAKIDIEDQFSNAFLEDKDVRDAFTEEELQERANENNENMKNAKQQAYVAIIIMDLLALVINLLILSLVPKKMLDKYNGVVEIEKKVKREE